MTNSTTGVVSAASPIAISVRRSRRISRISLRKTTPIELTSLPRPGKGKRLPGRDIDLAVELAIQDSAQLREIGDVLSRRKSRVDADLRGHHADPAADLLRRDLGVKAEDLDRPGVRREHRADDAQGGGLAGAVGTEQAEDLARVRL